jgi:phenylacetate-CoA ligase
MSKTFMPAFKDIKELEAHQLKGLQWTVGHAYQGSNFYRERLEEAGVRPEDIQSLEDIRKLPFTMADDLKEGYPFPLLAVPQSQVTAIPGGSNTCFVRNYRQTQSFSLYSKRYRRLASLFRPVL